MKDQSCIIRQNCAMWEHKDLQATAMSVDWSGQWVLLAGRRHLALQRIDQHDECIVRKYHRNSKYDVSAAEWAICQRSQEYCALATSQLIEVVTWSSGDPTLIHSLRAHTRMVTDIDWHSKAPHLLASCSIDTFTHLWDLRDPRKPILSLSAVCMSGATQVGFNRVSGNLLATAHDGDLRIWDIRKGSCPIQYITAHLARIHGINWSHNRESYLATASQDGTVKYFDVNNPRRADKIITTSSPVWRARYTPIGNGLVSIVVPHLGRGENSLLLWSNNKQTEPVCSFVGHTDVILDFSWKFNRTEMDKTNEIEFMTWSRDQTLRLWKLDDNLLKLCEPTMTDDDDQLQVDVWQQSSSKTSGSEILSKSLTDQPSFSLQHEFSLLNTNIPHIEIDTLDPVKRIAVVKVTANNHQIILQVNFPNEYPCVNVYPEFDFCPGTSIDENLSMSLMKMLKSCALQRSKKGRTCLEQCLRSLVTGLKRSTGGDKTQFRLQSPKLEGALTGALHDACIPFPRTSGARFNNSGLLVTFSQSLHTKRISLRHQNTTPRALSAISGGYLGNVMGSQPVLYAHRDSNTSTFYLQDRIRKHSRSRTSTRTHVSAVINVYNISKLLNVTKTLAEKYVLKPDIIETCRHNLKVAESYGRTELTNIWYLAEVIASSTITSTEENDSDMLFQSNPFNKSLLESLILHFAKYGDIQTAVMLCCTFEKHYSDFDNSSNNGSSRSTNRSPSISPYHTIVPVEAGGANQNWNLAMQLKQLRSNSWSDSLDWIECKLVNNNEISRKSKKHLFDTFKKVYGEILYGWNLLTERAMILKHLSYAAEPPQCVEFVTECMLCNRINRTPSCSYCRKFLLHCTLCRLPVKGAANACLFCGHGGHTEHLKRWFEKHDVCASGCGCHCLRESANLLSKLC